MVWLGMVFSVYYCKIFTCKIQLCNLNTANIIVSQNMWLVNLGACMVHAWIWIKWVFIYHLLTTLLISYYQTQLINIFDDCGQGNNQEQNTVHGTVTRDFEVSDEAVDEGKMVSIYIFRLHCLTFFYFSCRGVSITWRKKVAESSVFPIR